VLLLDEESGRAVMSVDLQPEGLDDPKSESFRALSFSILVLGNPWSWSPKSGELW